MPIGINGPLSGSDGNDESTGSASDASRRAESDVRPVACKAPQPLHGLPRASEEGFSADTVPPAEQKPRLMITAGQPLRDRFEAALASRLHEQLREAGDGIAEAIGTGTPASVKADWEMLPIINARQRQLRTFVHRTPDTFAIIAQDDPAFFAGELCNEGRVG